MWTNKKIREVKTDGERTINDKADLRGVEYFENDTMETRKAIQNQACTEIATCQAVPAK